MKTEPKIPETGLADAGDWAATFTQIAALQTTELLQAGERFMNTLLDLQTAWFKGQEAWMASWFGGAFGPMANEWSKLWLDAVAHDLQERRGP
jgi:hypothetical protein